MELNNGCRCRVQAIKNLNFIVFVIEAMKIDFLKLIGSIRLS